MVRKLRRRSLSAAPQTDVKKKPVPPKAAKVVEKKENLRIFVEGMRKLLITS